MQCSDCTTLLLLLLLVHRCWLQRLLQPMLLLNMTSRSKYRRPGGG
jgi:hypothetical protein